MASKKQKRSDEDMAEVTVDPVTVAEAWELMKRDGPTLFGSLAEYAKAWDNDETETANSLDPTHLFMSQYYKDASLENKFHVPREFRGFDIQRSKKGEIVAITDKGNVLKGKSLGKVLAFDAMRSMDAGVVIWGDVDGGRVEVLMVPKGVQVEPDVDVKNKKEFHAEARTVYSRKAIITVYAPEADVGNVLKLEFVKLGSVKALLTALNSLAMREDMAEFDGDTYTTIEKIQAEIRDAKVKESRRNFFNTLFGAKIESMGLQEKIDFFAKDPSFRLAHQLGIRLPHRGPAFSQANNKAVKQVPLTELGDDDSVLLSTNVISQQEYLSLVSGAEALLVIKDSDDVGAKKANKWAKMNVKFTMKAKDLRGYLDPIYAANKKEGSQAGSQDKASTISADGLCEVELD
jgi:hypothetical protein